MEPTPIELGTNGLVCLTGEVREPVWLSMAVLRSMPQREMTVSFECRASGLRRHCFSEPRVDPGERKDRLTPAPVGGSHRRSRRSRSCWKHFVSGLVAGAGTGHPRRHAYGRDHPGRDRTRMSILRFT
ncbi:hypothetical protein [Nonomuraea sp. LPB2021202275-12-8]|uniref:hypothetical protein n=1 Tax=Nonomuraea sp. LPB2021202275-12-8 TaxID=3120159 RepID=UPI00300C2CC2